MKTMMKTMLALAALFTVASASAQPQRGEQQSPEERAQQMAERMAERLELTDAQKQQIYDLHIELAPEARPERPARGERGERPGEEEIEARKAMMETAKARMDEMDARLESILTPEQYARWKESRERTPRPEGGPRMHDRGRGPHAGHGSAQDHERGPRPRQDRDGHRGQSNEAAAE
ncbi:MAG: DUF4890 domain-containing protein [Alistipes sp.]|nr:DUF4890 domain-containing protein [Alistipes sp.]